MVNNNTSNNNEQQYATIQYLFLRIHFKTPQSFTSPPSKNQPLQYTTLFNLSTIKILVLILLTVCHTIHMT